MSTLNPTSFAEVTRLHRAATNGLKGTLVVTATQAGEGTSLMAYLIARRSAEDGRRTLLIDLNLKNHHMTTSMGLQPQAWNLSYLKTLEEVADLAVPQIPTLDVLPAPSDTESVRWLCDQEQSQMLFEALEKRYDHIVIDTTPLTLTNRNNADPILLAAAATRTLFVLKTGVTPKNKVKHAVRDLQNAGANILGIVANDSTYQSPQDTMLAIARVIKRFSPSLAEWITHRAQIKQS